MDIKTILPTNRSKHKLSWTIVIEPTTIQVALWFVDGDTTKLISNSASVVWNDETLIESVDTCLTEAITKVVNIENWEDPVSAVFGVPVSWVSDGQIKDSYLLYLQRISTELSIKASGYVVLSEAIANFLKSEEGVKFSGVIIHPSPETIDLSVYQDGKVVFEDEIAKSNSVTADIKEGLVRFTPEKPLVPRFVLFNSDKQELEDIKQELVKYDWEGDETMRFLHAPTVDILDSYAKLLGVSLAGATETQSATKATLHMSEEQENQDSFTEKDREELVNVSEKTADELGFNIDGEIMKPASEILGIEQDSKEAKDEVVNQTQSATTTALPQEQLSSKSVTHPAPAKKRPKLTGVFKKPKFPNRRSLLLALPFLIVLLLVGGLVAFWWTYPEADVTIYVSPKTNNDQFTFRATKDSVVIGSKTVPVTVVDMVKSAKRTKSATGSMTVGESARGSIEIRNGTEDEIELSSGETISSSNNLQFTLDEAVTISPAESPTSPGSQVVSVTAAEIGADYNLAKDEKFSVAGFSKSAVDAVATDDFSGGESRSQSAVSEEDLKILKNELDEELKKESSKELESKLPPDTKLLDGVIATTVTKETYSAKAGDAVDSVSLEMEVKVIGYAVKSQDFFTAVNELLSGKISDGYVLRENQLDYKIDAQANSQAEFEGDITVTANLLPQVDTDYIQNLVAGNYPQIAEKEIKEIVDYSQIEIIITPKLPGRLGTLPKKPGNIQVEVAAAK